MDHLNVLSLSATVEQDAQLILRQHLERHIFAQHTHRHVVFGQISVLSRRSQSLDTVLDQLINGAIGKGLKVLLEVGLC